MADFAEARNGGLSARERGGRLALRAVLALEDSGAISGPTARARVLDHLVQDVDAACLDTNPVVSAGAMIDMLRDLATIAERGYLTVDHAALQRIQDGRP